MLSEAERALHNATHAKLEPWCEDCVKGRAKEDRHERASASEAPDVARGENLVEMDFQFFSRQGVRVAEESRLCTLL